jgi:hypothetical protein
MQEVRLCERAAVENNCEGVPYQYYVEGIARDHANRKKRN